MTSLTPDTRTLLLLTAGELFAEHGFDGVSTRMIAEKAGVNLGGIHYHFGSKETLYVEAFRYVCEHDQPASFVQVLQERPELGETDDGLAMAVWIVCQRFMSKIFSEGKPPWHTQLVIRELSSPSAAMPLLVKDFFRPETEDSIDFFLKLKPTASQDEALIWSSMAKSQVIFLLLARTPMEIMREGRPLDAVFMQETVRMTATAMIRAVGLPVPAGLQDAVGGKSAGAKKAENVKKTKNSMGKQRTAQGRGQSRSRCGSREKR